MASEYAGSAKIAMAASLLLFASAAIALRQTAKHCSETYDAKSRTIRNRDVSMAGWSMKLALSKLLCAQSKWVISAAKIASTCESWTVNAMT